nr:MAG TPA: hypothetical protein [Caudoviricetes sp.]
MPHAFLSSRSFCPFMFSPPWIHGDLVASVYKTYIHANRVLFIIGNRVLVKYIFRIK